MPTTRTASTLVSRTPEARPRPPDLDDPDQFEVREAVPILDVHDHPTKGKVDRALLKLLAKNSNKRAARGNFGLTLLGHTTDDGPETAQPPVVGYVRNYVVGRFHGRPCLLADFHFARDQIRHALTFPHRSVERVESEDPASNYIDAVALLRRAPERPLSLLTHRRQDPRVRVVRYSRDLPPIGPGGGGIARPAKESPMTPNGSAEVMNPEFKNLLKEVIRDVLSEFIGGDPEPAGMDDGLGGAAPDDMGMGAEAPSADDLGGDGDLADDLPETPEEGQSGTESAAEADDDDGDLDDEDGDGNFSDDEDDEEDDDEDGPKVVKHGMAAPCATNGFVPGVVKAGKKTKHARDAAPVRYARVIAEKDSKIAELEKALKAKTVRYARETARRGVLEGLAQEGYDLDVQEELKDTIGLKDAKFDRHVEKIRTRYAQVPLGDGPIATRKPRPSADGDDITAEERDQVVRYARENKVGGQEAVNGFLKQFRANHALPSA